MNRSKEVERLNTALGRIKGVAAMLTHPANDTHVIKDAEKIEKYVKNIVKALNKLKVYEF